MKTKRRALRGTINTFANDLRQLAQVLNEGVSFLNKATQHKPSIGPSEFQETLSNIQEDVADLTAEVENLERFTFDTISFDELIGHCAALYQANRTTIEHLEAHLHQYGYRQPTGIVFEPENPLSEEAVAAAAAKTRLRGEAQSAHYATSSDEEEDDECEADYRCPKILGGAVVGSSFKAYPFAPPTMGTMGPISLHANSKNHRKGSPAAKPRLLPWSSSEDEALDDGHSKDGSDKEIDIRPDKCASFHWTQLPPGADATAVVGAVMAHRRTAGAMIAKGDVLMSVQKASLDAAATAAASVLAAERNAPMSWTAAATSKRNSPERLYSPETAKLLAKLNPPETKVDEEDIGPISLAVSFDLANLPEPAASELSTAIRDLAPFGYRRGSGGTDASAGTAAVAQPPLQIEVTAAAVGPTLCPLRQPAAAAPQTDDMDTCTLYQELIRRPAPPPMQQPQKPKPFVPPLKLGQNAFSASALPAERSLSQRQLWSQPQQQPVGGGQASSARFPPPLSPRPPLPPPAGSTPELERPTVSGASSRCATPLSALRSNREQHNKLLAEKMAGLEREWIESGQAALTPMRRSLAGAATANNDIAPLPRPKSPGPSRALAEAAAAAAAALLSQPLTAWGPERSQQGTAAVDPCAQRQKDGEAHARALSSFQLPTQANTAAAGTNASSSATTPRRQLRRSGLPGPSPLAAGSSIVAVATTQETTVAASASTSMTSTTTTTTTVLGATTLHHRDSNAGDASIRSSLGTKSATNGAPRTPTQRGIGTPGRAPQASSSPPITAITSNATAASRRTDPATPRGAVRLAMAGNATAAAGLEVRASKLTPHRRSYAATPSEVAAAAAAIEPLTITTPRRARRMAAVPTATDAMTSAAVASGTPGRIHAAAGAATAASTTAPPVVPQLRLDACRRADAADRGRGGAWAGFPLSRRGGDSSNKVGAHPVSVRAGKDISDAGSSPDEVTLGMPPAVSNPNTPTAPTSGGPNGAGGPPAAGMFSPNAVMLASHPLGDIFGHSRPASRIPTPGRRGSARSGMPSTTVDTSATILEPCSEEEWRTLPGTLQLAFPLEVLNGYMRTLAQVLTNRLTQTDAAAAKCFSAADLEPLSLNSASAKRLLNLLVKLGRCHVASAGGIGSGTLLYRLST
ncbi:hypothetical protein Vretimale_12932 [Volvox reticuliferus]|uniref:Spindle and kinetochore-associated protein 3 n=1 Tax=Volvox reticuliferus TaxID=1737510 RepID=A0A8J4CD15_9CHLO|nr:hypothetical protein Vretifemale_9293 [Volvox reticuliferus]GIM09045.1 hypothetical protein Vretimale_12932 [Volvox reticuliferus]